MLWDKLFGDRDMTVASYKIKQMKSPVYYRRMHFSDDLLKRIKRHKTAVALTYFSIGSDVFIDTMCNFVVRKLPSSADVDAFDHPRIVHSQRATSCSANSRKKSKLSPLSFTIDYNARAIHEIKIYRICFLMLNERGMCAMWIFLWHEIRWGPCCLRTTLATVGCEIKW